jgi:hypothetical protein
MTVLTAADGTLFLEGECPNDDAETLLQHLLAAPTAAVDLRNCERAHTSVLQILLAARPRLLGPPEAGTSLWRWVYPALISHKQTEPKNVRLG